RVLLLCPSPPRRTSDLTLPALDGDDVHAVQRLAAEGPATETVGLDGLGGYGDAPPSAAEMTEAMAAAPNMSGYGSSAPAPGGCSDRKSTRLNSSHVSTS